MPSPITCSGRSMEVPSGTMQPFSFLCSERKESGGVWLLGRALYPWAVRPAGCTGRRHWHSLWLHCHGRRNLVCWGEIGSVEQPCSFTVTKESKTGRLLGNCQPVWSWKDLIMQVSSSFPQDAWAFSTSTCQDQKWEEKGNGCSSWVPNLCICTNLALNK